MSDYISFQPFYSQTFEHHSRIHFQKQSLNDEIEQLSELLKQLRTANNKFVDSKLALSSLTPDTTGFLLNRVLI